MSITNGISLIILSICLISCNMESNPQNSSIKQEEIIPPNTPEKVIEYWQHNVDVNNFELARLVSTPSTISWLNMVEKLLSDFPDEELEQTTAESEIFNIQCQQRDTLALCQYNYTEKNETYLDTIFLVKRNNKWLVDIQNY